jgi:DNA-directed RNA polymerase specialized sigma24 family protein
MTNEASESRATEPNAEPNAGRRGNRRKASYLLTEADEFLLGQLPAPYVEILRQEGSMEEIARRLNIAPGTVKSRTHRARAALDRLRAQARREAPQ